MSKYEGAWRRVSKPEWEALKAAGENVDWIEGAGLIVYDKQALEEFQVASARIAATYPAVSQNLASIDVEKRDIDPGRDHEGSSIQHYGSGCGDMPDPYALGRDDLHRPLSAGVVRAIMALPGLIVLASFVAGFAAGFTWARL